MLMTTRYVIAAKGALTLLRDPDRLDQVFALSDAVSTPAQLRRLTESLRCERASGW